MTGDFFMTRRQKFKTYYESGMLLKDIAHHIGISYKTTQRWKALYHKGQLLKAHGLRAKKGNKTSTMDKNKILNEYLESSLALTKNDDKVSPYTFSYFVRHGLKSKCSLSTFKNIMKENLVASPWARKITKKTYNKLLKAKLVKTNEKTTTQQVQQIIDLNSKFYFRHPRPDYEGQEGQIDACKDYWLDNNYMHLHAAYDPAVRRITALYLGKEETTHNYYKLLEILIENNNVPTMFKGDCRSSFVINKKNAGALAHKDVNTQFGFVLDSIGIKMENSSEPTFKGGVERSFRTMQSQLKQEFRERGIKGLKEANEYLKIYQKQFNDQYSIEAKKPEIKFVPLNMNKQEINELLSVRSYRKTDKGNSISYKNSLYSLYDQDNNRLAFKEKSAILVLETLDGNTIAKYFGETIRMSETNYLNLTLSQKEQYKNARRLTPNFSAPDDHPWGYNVFLWHLRKTENLKRYLSK